MNQTIINSILGEVKHELPKIFGDNMLFGFVCGGFSKGYADENHDVDTFICVKQAISEETEKAYLKWYFELHEKYGITADFDYPGEIVQYDYLMETLSILHNLKLTLKIEEVRTKKAIIWADMLTSELAAISGSRIDLLKKIQADYAHFPEQWKQEALALITPEEKAEWQDKSHLFIMERFMQYPKYDGKKLESVYGKST